LGAKIFANVNNLNNELFPTRGVVWHNELNVLSGINGNSKPFTEAHSDMNIYASLSDPAKLVAVIRVGGGHIFSKNFEFFQSMSVGQNNYLRGFRKNRFSGRSLAYTSLELRAKLFDINNYLLPGAIGLVGFDDVARVWSDGEQSKRWHNSLGGGLYYVPYNMFLVSATTAYSSEGWLFNLTIGTKFNMTF
jgi:outer membrane protein assembly factor BamA